MTPADLKQCVENLAKLFAQRKRGVELTRAMNAMMDVRPPNGRPFTFDPLRKD